MRARTSREIRLLLGNAALVIGLAGVAAVVAVALFGPSLAPYDPQAQRVVVIYPDGSYEVPPTAPNRHHLLGTDPIGRDILSRLLWGARLTIGAMLLALAVRLALGIGVGLLAGWRRGAIEGAAAHLTNAVSGIPQLLLALLLVVAFRDLGLAGFVIALAAVGWAEIAQFVRAETIRLAAAPYVEAARAIGASTRRIVFGHVVRGLVPQLLGIAALEAGAALILLAELGFIGFFISGGTFFTNDQGRPVLPVRDRAPEWGQMLAGARGYAYAQQWVAYVPALVVVAAVFSLNLLGEGLRAAVDPFGRHRLSPATLAAGARGLAGLLLVAVLAVGAMTVRDTQLSFDDALARARAAAARELPGGELVAAVVRFRSGAHALERPEKLNYYFRRPSEATLLRVGFAGADANAMEVKHFDDEDDVAGQAGARVPAWTVDWTRALATAEERGGLSFRTAAREYVVRVALFGSADGEDPRYRIRYGQPTSPLAALDFLIDGRSGDVGIPLAALVRQADIRAAAELRTEAQLVGARGRWLVPSSARALGSVAPAAAAFAYTSTAQPGSRSVLVSYDFQRGAAASASSVNAPTLGSGPVAAEPSLPTVELVARALGLVEERAGEAFRAQGERAGARLWSVVVEVFMRDGRPAATVTYESVAPAERQLAARFRVDPVTGEVVREQ